MSTKLNCWEFKNCGREPGGLMVHILGECPVSTNMKYDGVNDGKAAGRVCWRACSGDRQWGLSRNTSCARCFACDFYRRVQHEQEEKIEFEFASFAL